MIRQLTIIAILVLLGIWGVQAGLTQDLRPLLRGSPTNVENYVQDVFSMTQSSGSLTLSGTCMASTNADDQVVPDSIMHPPEGPFHNIDEALNALSQADPRVSWTRDAEGLLRVHDGRVRDDVLRIRLQRIHFSGAINPDEAIWSLLSTPEVRAYFKKNHIEEGLVFNHLWGVDTKDLPRLSGDLHDVTIAQALDRIMRFFHGLWIYSECTKGSMRRVVVKGALTDFSGTGQTRGRATVPSAITGVWIIKDAYKTKTFTAALASEARKLRGEKIVLTLDSLESCGQTVKITYAEQMSLMNQHLLEGMHVGFRDLDVHSHALTEVTLEYPEVATCMGTMSIPGDNLYIKGNNEIIVEWGGIFFRATRS